MGTGRNMATFTSPTVFALISTAGAVILHGERKLFIYLLRCEKLILEKFALFKKHFMCIFVLAPRSAHAWPFAQPPIDTSTNVWGREAKDQEEFDICGDRSWIRSQSILNFEKLKVQARELALESLNQIKSKHSKMDNLSYHLCRFKNSRTS